MALAKELTDHSLPEIGMAFEGRDHTTVLHACRQIRHLMDVVQSGAPSFVSALEGARNLAVMEAVRTAVESGRTTPVARISG